jgi:hypothetical protein
MTDTAELEAHACAISETFSAADLTTIDGIRVLVALLGVAINSEPEDDREGAFLAVVHMLRRQTIEPVIN